jgi:hypothetical protein
VLHPVRRRTAAAFVALALLGPARVLAQQLSDGTEPVSTTDPPGTEERVPPSTHMFGVLPNYTSVEAGDICVAHHREADVSGGNAIAATLSNLYYTASARTLAGTLTRWGMQVMWDTLSNEMKEFWPDIRAKLHHHAAVGEKRTPSN